MENIIALSETDNIFKSITLSKSHLSRGDIDENYNYFWGIDLNII